MHTTNYSAILCLLLCWATRILALPMIPSFPNPAYLAQLKEYDELFKRASVTRTKATTVTQSVNNWIEDVDTVNKFLNVALALPLGAPLKAGASKALAFAQDEPVNVKFLKATPGISSDGLAAAATLEKVFGDVLAQLGDVVKQPANLAVATNAVTRINVNRCRNVLPSAETMWKTAATATKIATADWPPKANREAACGPQGKD